MTEREKIEEFIDAYRRLEPKYIKMTKVMKHLLEKILEGKGIRFHQVTARAKSIYSLRERLERDNVIEGMRDVTCRDDLAGCRIIFYLESDAQKFSSYLFNEFDVLDHELKYSEDDYNAIHLTVAFNKNRLCLSEYASFADMKCEIQLTTVLFHAWSELAHNTIYKPEDFIPDFDKREYDRIKKRFGNVMKEHIKKTSIEFEYLHNTIERIKQGKKLFDIDSLSEIQNMDSNNDLYQKLKEILDFVQDYGDKTPSEFNIIQIIDVVLTKSNGLCRQPISTILGSFEGYGYKDVALVCTDILSQIRYAYRTEVFHRLVSLSKDSEQDVRKRAKEVLSEFADYDIEFLKNVGYKPQSFLLQEMERWDDQGVVENSEAILSVASSLLSTIAESTVLADYDTFSITRGALPASAELVSIRARTVDILKRVYAYSSLSSLKKEVLRTMGEMAKPCREQSSKDLDEYILNEANTLIEYFLEIVSEASSSVVGLIDQQARWLEHTYGEKKLLRLQELEDKIANNKEYDIYKAITGVDLSSLLLKMNYEDAIELIRDNRIKHISEMSEENYDAWKSRIADILEEMGVGDLFDSFCLNEFLCDVGKEKPLIANRLLSEEDKRLEPFLALLLIGLLKGDQGAKELGLQHIYRWISTKTHLSSCGIVFRHSGNVDFSLLLSLFSAAIDSREVNILSDLVEAVFTHHSESEEGKRLFVNIIKEMTANKDYSWVKRVAHLKKPITAIVPDGEIRFVLENLVHIPIINYEVEQILIPVAEDNPQQAIDFFHKRISFQRSQKKGIEYEAIPFHLEMLSEPLNKKEDVVILSLFKWFEDEERTYHRMAGVLIKLIFPSFNDKLEDAIITMLKSKNEQRKTITTDILRPYNGDPSTHHVCKELIKEFSSDKTLQMDIFNIISQTDGGFGEDWILKEYNRKKSEVQNWGDDENEAIRNFFESYTSFLDERIMYEEKRLYERLETMKKEFNTE